MVEKWSISIPELTGSETRSVYVYLPESYRYYPDQRYPVLYMFDGHNVFFDSDATFGKSWGMKDYLDATGTQLIVAAVECNHSPDYGRLKEYSPFSFHDKSLGIGKIEGLGDITIQWWVSTFKPLIDSRYRTIPDRSHTFIAGSSMGGLMSLYAALRYDDIFSRAAALSPSIWVAPGKLTAMAREKDRPDTVIYLDYGDQEFANHEGIRHQFARLTSTLTEHGICTSSRIVPGGTHCEASWERQIPYFMHVLLS
jgi:predicted alpha/beta superfamily hydrolase